MFYSNIFSLINFDKKSSRGYFHGSVFERHDKSEGLIVVISLHDVPMTKAFTIETKEIREDLSLNVDSAGYYPKLETHWMSVRQQRIFICLVFFAIGFSAITALSLALIGWLALDTAAYILVWPAMVTWLLVGFLYPSYGKLALKGFIIGLLACLLYDCMRFIAIAFSLWSDFIPKIGMLLLHSEKPNWIVGYIWRYIGDGGLMSVSFVVAYRLLEPKLDVRIASVLFGIIIWLFLLAIIYLIPPGILFVLTPTTFFLSLLGHIIYGFSIGVLYRILIYST